MEQLFRPIDGFRSGHRYNLDGFVAIGTQYRQGEGYAGYCQVFFSGAVEAVCSEILTEAKECGRRKDGRFIASIEYERDLITAVSAYLKAFHALGIGPPVSISLSLLGCRGAFMYAGDRIMDRLASRGRLHAIDRDVAHLPDVFIENLDVDNIQIDGDMLTLDLNLNIDIPDYLTDEQALLPQQVSLP